MKRIAILVFILACSLASAAESLKGIVQNNTTNKPSAGDEVTLKKIGNGMEDVAKTKTNAKGEFSFTVPPAQQPYVIWIQHQGVTYTQRAMPGGNVVVARVFDASPDIKEISIIEHAMLFHTGDVPNTLSAEEIFSVINNSKPARTLLKPHTLEFSLPEGASIGESSVRTGSGMDLKTAVIPQGEKNKYAFVFPIRPGETQFHIVYSLPYSGKLKIDPKSDTAVETLVVAAPESIKFAPDNGSIYQNKNNPQFKGVNFFVAKNVTPQQQVAFEIAGSGEMPREPQDAAAGGQSRPANSRPGGGLGLPNEMPSPLQSGQWVFLAVLSLFLAAGAVYVYTSSQQALVPGGSAQPKDRGGMLMEAMREELFQLESDRLQGKISPQDYLTAKAALDKTLQRAMQRQSSATT
ncbi:MAG TPA: hypothetical protein VE133_10740 [Candidatus Sulfotelmatobacter sp.]|nr:hypothetical protein [Candidatus Sulfotelmatobacter sp.]